MSKRAILIVDLQNEYQPSGKLPLNGIDAAVTNAARIIADARVRGDSIVHIRHEAPSPDAPFFTPGSHAVEIIAAVAPENGEQTVVKNFPNSFRATSLHRILKDHGVGTVVILGAMSHMCIDATTRAAADLGYETVVVHDACATLDLEFEGTRIEAAAVHAAQMAALAFGYASVRSTAQWLADVQEGLA